MLIELEKKVLQRPDIDAIDDKCAMSQCSLAFLTIVEFANYGALCLLFSVVLALERNKLDIICQLFNPDRSKLDVQTNDLALILIRLFNGMNGAPSSSVIYLHTSTKIITVRHTSNHSTNDFKTMLNNKEDTIKFICSQIVEIKNRVRSAIPQIFFLCNRQTTSRESVSDKIPPKDNPHTIFRDPVATSI